MTLEQVNAYLYAAQNTESRDWQLTQLTLAVEVLVATVATQDERITSLEHLIVALATADRVDEEERQAAPAPAEIEARKRRPAYSPVEIPTDFSTPSDPVPPRRNVSYY